MKISTNLPRALRILFNVSRAMVVISAVLTALVACIGFAVREKTSSNLLQMPALGELVLAPDLKTLGLAVTLDGAVTPDLVVATEPAADAAPTSSRAVVFPDHRLALGERGRQ